MDIDARPPRRAVQEAVARALAEDIGPLGDLTAAVLAATATVTAAFVPRAGGVLAGVDCAVETFRQLDPDVDVDWLAGDGDGVAAGAVIGRVRGPIRSVLTGERCALNFLCHLSGIATCTRRFVDAAAGAGTARVWDTRKTTPGLRSLEKAAVRAGGGANHRGNLSDWVLLKDNHLAHLGVAEAVRRARQAWPARTVHVECDRLSQVQAALAAGADAVLLDNMSPAEVRVCVEAADAHAAERGGRRPLLEASGGVTLESVPDYAATGVDCISVGSITIGAPVLDIGLDLMHA